MIYEKPKNIFSMLVAIVLYILSLISLMMVGYLCSAASSEIPPSFTIIVPLLFVLGFIGNNLSAEMLYKPEYYSDLTNITNEWCVKCEDKNKYIDMLVEKIQNIRKEHEDNKRYWINYMRIG